MATIFLVAVIGSVVSAVVGTLWYNASLTPMGKWHMQYLGFDKLTKEQQDALIKQQMPKMWKTYVGQIALSFLTSFFIAFVTSFSVQNGALDTAVYAYVVMTWACFTIPMIGQNILWGTSEGSLAWKRFFSDSLSNLVSFTIIAYIATLFF